MERVPIRDEVFNVRSQWGRALCLFACGSLDSVGFILSVSLGAMDREVDFTSTGKGFPCPSFLRIRLGSFGSFFRLSAPARLEGGRNVCGIFDRGFPVTSAHGGFMLRFLSCRVRPPHCSVRRYVHHNLACDIPLGTALGLSYASRSRRSFSAIVRSICLNPVPCVARGNAFIVGNTRHIVMSRLRHSPNIFFKRDIRAGNTGLCSTHVVPFHNS